MAERYLDLALADRREVLDVAASASDRPAHLLEKDVWVLWTRKTLGAPARGAARFKRGTLPSKACRTTRCFSDDRPQPFEQFQPHY